MKRTIRLIAAPSIALLLLASCGSTNEPEASDSTTVQETSSSSEAADESDASPIADDGNGGEDSEGEPMDDGGDDSMTDSKGNVTAVEFAGETYEINIDAMAAGEYPSTGTYFLEGMTGVKALAEIDAEGPEAMEGLRESYGAEPVTYIRFDVDNRNGSEEILMLELNMYDTEGNEYTFETFTSLTNEWSEDADYRVTEEQEAYYDALDDADYESANVGQRNEQWLVGPADLPENMTIMHATTEVFADEFYPFPVN